MVGAAGQRRSNQVGAPSQTHHGRYCCRSRAARTGSRAAAARGPPGRVPRAGSLESEKARQTRQHPLAQARGEVRGLTQRRLSATTRGAATSAGADSACRVVHLAAGTGTRTERGQ
eukprot:6013561-Prymnesium_polylepis.2